MTPPGTKSPVAVVVDSAASLPPEMGGVPLLQVAPMRLAWGDRTYLDGRDLSAADFYRMLRESPSLPTTSAPSPPHFIEAFSRSAEEARSIVCLTVGSRFSSSFDSARSAAEELHESHPGVEVSVLDTESAAGGQGLIALEAWRAARRGSSLADVVDVVRNMVPRVTLLAALDTLRYLWKGGRVPKIAHAGASLLQIKPVFELARGEVRTMARPRTRRRAMARLLDLMRVRVQSASVHAAVMHADAVEWADELRARIEAEFPCEEIFVSQFTPAMGAHIGPGLLGVAFWSE